MSILPRIIFRFKTDEKNIALTFDDGPHPEYTPIILDTLKRENIQATFFVTGQNAETYPGLIQRISEDGHEIANHGYSHRNLIFKSKKFIQREIEKTDTILRDLGITGKIHFRPPYGRILINCFLVAQKLDKKIILWNIPTKDYRITDSKKILLKIKKRLKPGGIIVLHDSKYNNIMNDKGDDPTIITVKQICKTLPEQGYKFKTISDLID